MNRRTFLRTAIFGSIPFLMGQYDFLQEYSDYTYIKPVKSQRFARIVSGRDGSCVSANYSINSQRAAEMLRRGILEYTRKNSMGEAIRSLFPAFRPDLRVSIKINTASSIMPSHQVLAETMASCLVEAGIAPGNIIIWERSEETMRDAGYTIRNGSGEVKIVATDTPGYGYDESRTERIGGVPVYLTSILTQHSDYLINIAALKHHYFTGVTGTQKNLYGTIPLVDRPFLIGLYDLMRLHLNHSDPYISELSALVGGRVPTVLYICDALLGSYNNGPLGPPQWAQNEILLGNDPVAIDTLMLYRVALKRREAGLPPVLYKARHILTSANMGLGTNNPANMDITSITDNP